MNKDMMGYGSTGVTKAYPLCARSIILSAPPGGTGGNIDSRKWAEGYAAEMLECPGQVMKEPEEELPDTKLLVGDGE